MSAKKNKAVKKGDKNAEDMKKNELKTKFPNLDVSPLIKDYMIREAFNMFDEDRSGEIDKREFNKLITSLGLEIPEKRINELIKELDKDGSGSIEYEEFRSMISKFQFGKESPIYEHLQSAFNDFDKDMDGLITIDDYIKVSNELEGISVTKEDAEMWISMCKHFAKENNVEGVSEDSLTPGEYINALIGMGFLFENKNLAKAGAGAAKNVISGNTSGIGNQSGDYESNANQSEKNNASSLVNKNKESNVGGSYY